MTSVNACPVRYRADIDGLRGIAVLAVVLYHLDIGPFGGGFVGVDIFFVISGFLITAIVHAEIEAGRFTFTGFYERRVRRLFPALFATLLVTTLAGIWLLLPLDLLLLGKSAVAALLFASNIFFWRESGYFDNSSEINPLLHTWSLAVEEQFYIGLPILLLLTYRLGRRHLALVLTLTACTSLAACLLIQPLRPSAVFYLSPFRAWELLVGALLALGAVPAIRNSLHRELTAMIGLLFVVGSIVYIRPGVGFPGWQATAPVLGAAALIHVGSTGGESVAHRVLRFRPLVHVGLISYSLYLWHWPLIAFAKYRNGLEPLGEWKWIILTVALATAALSYKFIEKPFRRRSNGDTPQPLFAKSIVAGGLLAATSAIVIVGDGWPGRFAPAIVAFDNVRQPTIPFMECASQASLLNSNDSRCLLGAAGVKPTLLVWGDSHALAWAPAFDNLLRKNGNAAILAVCKACPPLPNFDCPRNTNCLGFNKQVIEWLRTPGSPQTVAMIASWTKYSMPEDGQVPTDLAAGDVNEPLFEHLLIHTVRQLHDSGKSVWIIGPTPGAPSAIPLRSAMARMHGGELPIPNSTEAFQKKASSFYVAVSSLRNDQEVMMVTDPAPWFCDSDSCAFMNENLLLYRDEGHLSRYGATYLEPFLEPVLMMVMRPGGQYPTIIKRPPSGASARSSLPVK